MKKALEEALNQNGVFTVVDGLYVFTKDQILADSESWGDSDLSKDLDFSLFEFWLVTDSGAEPEGFSTIAEVLSEVTAYI